MQKLDWRHCPPVAKASLDRYVLSGCPVGGFLTAVLSNDLKAAVSRADEENYALLHSIVAYCYCRLPSICWGSPTKYTNWMKMSQEDRLIKLGITAKQAEEMLAAVPTYQTIVRFQGDGLIHLDVEPTDEGA
jgi:hypothetical protein